MRKLTLMMATSLDAKVAGADGDLGWFRNDDGMEVARREVLHQVDAMIFGRVAYEELARFWPTAGAASMEEAPGSFTSAERAEEFAHLLNTIPKLVVSHAPPDLPWGPARAITGDVVGALRALKAEDGGDLVAFAGAGLATTLLDADLVDEVRLMVHPVVLGGEGLALFDRLEARRRLDLVDVTRFDSGVVELGYRAA